MATFLGQAEDVCGDWLEVSQIVQSRAALGLLLFPEFTGGPQTWRLFSIWR